MLNILRYYGRQYKQQKIVAALENNLSRKSARQVEFSEGNRFLFILLSSIGDAVMAQPTWTALKDSIPAATIDLVCWPHLAALFGQDPCLNRIFPFQESRTDFWKRQDLLVLENILLSEQYDFLIAFAQIPLTAVVCSMPSAPPSIGLKRVSVNTTRTFDLSVAYDYAVPYTDGEPIREIASRLVSPWVDAAKDIPTPVIYLSGETMKSAKETIKALHLSEGENFVLLAPGAKWPPKRWPLHYWSELIDLATRRLKLPLILVGGKQDEEILRRITEDIRGLRPRTLLTEDLALSSALINLAELCICNDSAPMHLSAAVATRSLALFGPVSPNTSAPSQKEGCHILYENMYCSPCTLYYSRERCRRGINFCLHSITPEQVLQKLEEMI